MSQYFKLPGPEGSWSSLHVSAWWYSSPAPTGRNWSLSPCYQNSAVSSLGFSIPGEHHFHRLSDSLSKVAFLFHWDSSTPRGECPCLAPPATILTSSWQARMCYLHVQHCCCFLCSNYDTLVCLLYRLLPRPCWPFSISKMDRTWHTRSTFRAEEDKNSFKHSWLILGPKMAHFCPENCVFGEFWDNWRHFYTF